MPDLSALSVILNVLQRRWRALALIVLIFLCGGAAIALLSTPVYRASVTLLPRSVDGPSGGLSTLLDQVSGLSGIANLTGAIGDSGGDSMAVLRSRTFFETFAKKRNVLPVLFESQWDIELGQWRASLESNEIPTMDDAWELFNARVRTIAQDQQTGIVTLAVTWKDRALAADWANTMAELINETQRARATAEANTNIAQLQSQLEKTAILELQQSIYRLMEVEIKKDVLAQSRRDYAFTVVDPASVPDEDRFVSPKRTLIIATSLILGLLMATLALIVDESRRLLPPPPRVQAAL